MNAARLQELACEVGLDAAGAAPVGPYTDTEQAIRDRSERGLFADMSFTMARPERSCHPETLIEGARTVVAGAFAYYAEGSEPGSGQAALPRYAWTDAYALLRERLEQLGQRIGGRYRVLVDENDHVDREAAARAGVGFYGKNTMIITPEHGSWVVLGVLVTDAEIEASTPLELGCGDCTLCIDACPSGALNQAGELDAEHCLSYWTQSRRPVPVELRAEFAGQVYGCDICQDVCPWNRPGAKRSAVASLRRGSADGEGSELEPLIELAEWLTLPDEELRQRYDRLYFPRNDVRYLRRNALVAAGAAREVELLELVTAYAAGDDEFLAEHASWALGRIDWSGA